MITKEMIEEAAGIDSSKTWEIYEGRPNYKALNRTFIDGANWAIQQMNNDAVEFAEWTGLKFWKYLNTNKWELTDLFDDDYNKVITTRELYQLYLNSKNTKQFQFRFIRGDKNKDTTVYTVVEI